jgi:hypothetical protein
MASSRSRLSGDGYAYDQITVADTAVGLGTNWQTGEHTHIRAVLTAFNGHMRYRYDGTAPTSTTGHLLSHGDSLIIEGSVNVNQFKAIRAGSQSGVLCVTFERIA